MGVAGWNISLLVRTAPAVWWGRLGTLLGPEKTPVVVFLGAIPGRAGLTRMFFRGGGGGLLGCGCVLSVA